MLELFLFFLSAISNRRIRSAFFIATVAIGFSFASSEIDLSKDRNIGTFGNEEKVDYFRLLEVDGTHLIVGAADNVFNLTIIRENDVIRIKNSSHYAWPPTKDATEECKKKARDPNDCQNFIRILALDKRNGDLLVCGTNAYKPLCRLLDSNDTRSVRREFSGVGSAPLEPRYNTSFLLDGDYLYSAAVSDFAGADPLIFRRSISSDKTGIRTERNNLKQLNKPQFAGRISTKEHVYFFFRERIPKVETGDSFGTNGLYSRVARICKNDPGGPGYYSNEFVTFVKAQLNCSVPGSKQFFFDQIVSISNIIEVPTSTGMRRLVYATFVSGYDFISNSAICAFDLDEIDAIFDNSDFLVSDSTKSTYTKLPRPENSLVGTCPETTQNLTIKQMQTLKATPLMANLVPNTFNQAVGIYYGNDHYNQIAILPEVRLPDHNHRVDVLYVGTDQGNVIKFISLRGTPKEKQLSDPMIKISVMNVANAPIRRLLIFEDQYLVALTDRKVSAMPLAQCEKFDSCKGCVEGRDPHCGWHINEKRCMRHNNTAEFFIQDVLNGNAEGCKNHEKTSNSAREAAPNADGLTDAKLNKSALGQFKKHINCDCRHRSNCPCAEESNDIYAHLRSESSHDTPIEQTATTGWHFPQWLLIFGLIVQLVIIVALIICYTAMKKKSKSESKSNTPSGFILAYDNGSPGSPSRSTTGTLKTTTISPNPVPFTYGGSAHSDTSTYEPFHRIHVDTQSEGYQSDSLGSKSGSDVASRMEGCSQPFRQSIAGVSRSISRVNQ